MHNSIYLMVRSIYTECLINQLTQQPPWAYCEITGDVESIFEKKAIDCSVRQDLRGATDSRPSGW